MWGFIPPPPRVKRDGYELLWLCEPCAKRRRAKKPLRAEATLLPTEFRICRDCSELHTCTACRDYGRD